MKTNSKWNVMRWKSVWCATLLLAVGLLAAPAWAQTPVPQMKPVPNLQVTPPVPPPLSLRVKPEGLLYAPHKQSSSWRIETVGGYEPITFELEASDSRFGQANALGTTWFEIVIPSSGTSNPINAAPVVSQPTLPTSGSISPPTIVQAVKPASPQTRNVRFKGLPDYAVGIGVLPVMAVHATAVDMTGRRKVGAQFDVQLTFATGPPVLHSLSLEGAPPAATVTTPQAASARQYTLDLSNWDSRDNPDLTRQTTSRIRLEYPNGLIYQGSADLRYTGSLGSPSDQCPSSRPCRIRVPDLGLGSSAKVTLANPYGRSQPITVAIQSPTIEITETETFSLPSNSAGAAASGTAGPTGSSSLTPGETGTCPQDYLVWKEIQFQDPTGRARLISGGQAGTIVNSSTLPRWEFKPGPPNASLQVTYRMTLRSPICPGLVSN